MPARKLSGIPYSDYYIGLDVGVSSAGWAVTDPLYGVDGLPRHADEICQLLL